MPKFLRDKLGAPEVPGIEVHRGPGFGKIY
jgi:hypothetical protein